MYDQVQAIETKFDQVQSNTVQYDPVRSSTVQYGPVLNLTVYLKYLVDSQFPYSVFADLVFFWSSPCPFLFFFKEFAVVIN